MKHFYSIVFGFVFCAFVLASCSKDNAAPQNAKQQSSGNSSKTSSGSSEDSSPTPPTDASHPSCHGH